MGDGLSALSDLGWINFIDPEKLRFENQKAAKPKKQALRFSLLFDLFVTSTGFKPSTVIPLFIESVTNSMFYVDEL